MANHFPRDKTYSTNQENKGLCVYVALKKLVTCQVLYVMLTLVCSTLMYGNNIIDKGRLMLFWFIKSEHQLLQTDILIINKHRLLQKNIFNFGHNRTSRLKKKTFEKINHLQNKFNIIRQNSLFDTPCQNVILRHV